jgi:hypothetical protein
MKQDLTSESSPEIQILDPNSAKELELYLQNQENKEKRECVGFEQRQTDAPPLEIHNYLKYENNPWAGTLEPIRVDEIPDDVNADATVRSLLAGRHALYYGPAILGGKKLILISRVGSPAPASGVVEALLAAALADVGKQLWRGMAGTENGNLGCAAAVTAILHDELHLNIAKTVSTNDLYEELKRAGWKKIDVTTSGTVIPPGAVIVSPKCDAMHGHTGIVGEKGAIYSNNSQTGLWDQHLTVDKWVPHYKPCGSYAFLPPAADASAAGGVKTGADFGGSAAGRAIYQKLLAKFQNSKVVGVVPPDGAKFGITTGSAEEWARFGTSVAKAESDFKPSTKNLSDPGGSFGIFQYAHNQVPGGNAYDIDASVSAFVRDSESSAGGLRAGILGRRFSTIGKHPDRGAAYLA